MKKVIAIDMDQVLADLLSDWVAYINTYDDPFLKEKDILCWDIKKYTNTNNNVYRHLDYDLFRNLNVIEGSQRVTKELMKKYEVYVVTTATNHPDSLKAKLASATNNSYTSSVIEQPDAFACPPPPYRPAISDTSM